MNGAAVLAGRVVSRAVPDLTGISTMIASGSMGSSTATLALAGLQLAAGILVGGLIKGDFGAYMIAGAFDGVYEDVATSFLNTTTVPGKYLGGYSRPLNLAARAVAGYSRSGVPPAAAAGRAAGRVGAAALRRIGIGAAARVAR